MTGEAPALAAPVELAGEVLAHERIAPDAGVVRFAVPGPAPTFAPGQFLQLRAWESVDPLLGRPFSLLDQGRGDDARSWLSVLYQVHGRGTARLGRLTPGEGVWALGPLGRPFAPPTRPGPALVVAGGVGIPPFLLVVRDLVARGVETVVLLGARDAAHLYLRAELAAAGAEVRLATEDGSAGRRGLVTDLLEGELAARGPAGVGAVYTCGPEGMLRAVVRIAQRAGVPGEASLERLMACGFGVCFTCVCRLRGPDGDLRNRRTCLDGPVVAIDALPGEDEGDW